MGSNIAPSDICMFSEAGLSDKVNDSETQAIEVEK